MNHYSTITNIYFSLWKKYRPAILKLMTDAVDTPQQYKFLDHEFTDINSKEKGGHSFNLQMLKGKAANNIKTSIVAQDLLAMLQNSKKAFELTENSTFEFMMDKQFLLHISSEKQGVEEPESESGEVTERKVTEEA